MLRNYNQSFVQNLLCIKILFQNKKDSSLNNINNNNNNNNNNKYVKYNANNSTEDTNKHI